MDPVADVETFEKILLKLQTGVMPPAGSLQPDADTRRSLIADLEYRKEVDDAFALANAASPTREEVSLQHFEWLARVYVGGETVKDIEDRDGKILDRATINRALKSTAVLCGITSRPR